MFEQLFAHRQEVKLY